MPNKCLKCVNKELPNNQGYCYSHGLDRMTDLLQYVTTILHGDFIYQNWNDVMITAIIKIVINMSINYIRPPKAWISHATSIKFMRVVENLDTILKYTKLEI